MNMFNLKKSTLAIAVAFTMALSVPAVILHPTGTVYAADASGATASIADIIKNQQSDGGWKKDYSVTSGDWAKSTIDNKATYTEIRRLAAEFKKTNNSQYSAAAIKGINFLLGMQYANGGFPQIYKSTGYHNHITYNDNAMVNVVILLDEVAGKKGDFSFIDSTLAGKSKQAVDKAVDCILKTQVIVNGKLTVWGQQHDSSTLKPAGARAYEVPSLCSSESVAIVNFLKTRTATTQITASINAAVDWFKAVKITGIKVVKTADDVVVVQDPSVTTPIWARFYEIGTNKPIFVGRDGVVKYKLSDIEQERRTGYSWYGNWPSNLIK